MNWLKSAAIKILETSFRVVGRNNPFFAFFLRSMHDEKSLSIYYKAPLWKKIVNILLRTMVKVSSFPWPILKTVEYTDGKVPLVRISLDVTDYTQIRYRFQYPDAPLRDLILAGGETFVDIGANVGIFSLLAARYFKRVYAFEPLPPVLQLLQQNCRYISNITVSSLALSDTASTTSLYQNAIGSGGSSLVPIKSGARDVTNKQSWNVYEIASGTADAVLANSPPIDLIKIDVEGHEVATIQGALQIIRRHHPLLFVETHDRERFDAICALLPPGYQIFDPVKRTFTTNQPFPDTLFVWPGKLALVNDVFKVRAERS